MTHILYYAIEETFYGRGEPKTSVHAFTDAGKRNDWVDRAPKRKRKSVSEPMPPRKMRRSAEFPDPETAEAACSSGGGLVYHKAL